MKKLSVIIVNYNGKEYADRCIDSVLSSLSDTCEVILVDNGSFDGSVDFLEKKYRGRVTLVKLRKNYGPARARNEGVKIARGRYICFLDNDTIVHKSWVEAAVAELEKDEKLGIIQCKLLLAGEKDKIDSVGEYLGQNGFLVQGAEQGKKDSREYDRSAYILSAKSAGMFTKKEVLDRVGGFDEDYFIYLEETDLSWRIWLAGYTAKFIPGSIVYHESGSSGLVLGKDQTSYNAKYHGCKNYILTLLKNLEVCNVAKIIPWHIFLWLGLAWFGLFKGDIKSFVWIHQGIWWNARNIRKNLRKRKSIQNARVITDKELFKKVLRKKPFGYFFEKASVKHKIGNAESYNS